jgi:RNA polymerase sigma factor (sigma-70 family)
VEALIMTRQSTSASAQLYGILGSLHLDQGPDGELLEQFVKGRDERAFAALVQRYSALVYGVCIRLLQNSHDADDAFQATFLVLARKAASLDGKGPLGNWLYTVAFRTATKAWAANAKRRNLERYTPETPMVCPLHDSEWDELRPILDEELNRLPKKYRSLLVLCYLKGKTHQEAARELGWPTGSISRRMHRARELLRHRLTLRGITLSSALLFALISRKATAAIVSPNVMSVTARAAVLFGARQFAGHTGVSIRTLQLAESVIGVMVAWKLVAMGALVLSLSVVGIGSLGMRTGVRVEVSEVPLVLPSSPGCDSPASDASKHAAKRNLSLVDQDRVRPVALAVTGNWLAMAGRSRHEGVRVWPLSEGKDLTLISKASFLLPAAGALSLAFSADGSLLASAGTDGTLAVWRVSSTDHSPNWQIHGHPGEGTTVAFSPDGRLLASGSTEGAIRLRNIASGNQVASLPGQTVPVRSIAFSLDGTKMATGADDGLILLWDISGRQSYAACTGHNGSVLSVSISGDSERLISTGADQTLRVWSMANGQPCSRPVHLAGTMVGAAFVGDGNLAVSLELGGALRFWNTKALDEIKSLRTTTAGAAALAVAAERTLVATGSEDRSARLWQIKGPASLQ